jgi:hypothetical protein
VFEGVVGVITNFEIKSYTLKEDLFISFSNKGDGMGYKPLA